jgi:hypothetical protein
MPTSSPIVVFVDKFLISGANPFSNATGVAYLQDFCKKKMAPVRIGLGLTNGLPQGEELPIMC